MPSGSVLTILAAQQSEGYWVQPGHGYVPKYRGTVWQIIFLAQLGADGINSGIQAGCEYGLANATSRHTVALPSHGRPQRSSIAWEGIWKRP